MTKTHGEIVYVLLAILFITSISQPINSSYPVIVNNYSVHVVFQNFNVVFNNKPLSLNGEVYGVVQAKYVFREREVVVSNKYLRYELKGFKTAGEREYITRILSGTVVRRYNYSEPPYSVDKAFIIEGGVKYYVSPTHLLASDSIEQHLVFPLGNRTYIAENRFFQYDRSTGVLITLNITSVIKVNETTHTFYMLVFKLIDSTTKPLLLKTLDYRIIAPATLTLYVILLLVEHKLRK